LAYAGSVGLWIFVCGLTAAALQRLFWREEAVLLCADCVHVEANAFRCCVHRIGICIYLNAAAPRRGRSVRLWIFVCGLTGAVLQSLFWREGAVLLCGDGVHVEAYAFRCCLHRIGICFSMLVGAPGRGGSVGLWIFVCGLTAAALKRLFWERDCVLVCAD